LKTRCFCHATRLLSRAKNTRSAASSASASRSPTPPFSPARVAEPKMIQALLDAWYLRREQEDPGWASPQGILN